MKTTWLVSYVYPGGFGNVTVTKEGDISRYTSNELEELRESIAYMKNTTPYQIVILALSELAND